MYGNSLLLKKPRPSNKDIYEVLVGKSSGD
jgi:hypothetical protein